jgi:hypothetical protein
MPLIRSGPAVAAIGTLALITSAQAELISNGSFENGLSSWAYSGNVLIYDNEGATDGISAAIFNSLDQASDPGLNRAKL